MNLQKTSIRKANKTIDKLNRDQVNSIFLEFTSKELDDLMRKLIDANVPVQVFLLMDQKIRAARMRDQDPINQETNLKDND